MRYSISCQAALFLLASPSVVFAQIELSGTLLQADGKAMAAAHLVVQNRPQGASLVVDVDTAGRYSFWLDEPGGYGLYATGVHHEVLQMPLILTDQEKVELHIRLRPNAFALSPDTLYVVPAETDEAARMERRRDGTYAVRADAYADTLAYRIRYGFEPSEWRSDKMIAGTAQDRLVFDDSGPFWDSEGDYFSVLEVRDAPIVDITFDPSVLPRHLVGPSIASDPPVIARIARVYLDVEEMERRIGMTGNFMSYVRVVGRERGAIKKRIASERDPLVRQWLLLRYFDEMPPDIWPTSGRRFAREAVETISADSPLWSFEAWSPVGASNIMYKISRKLKGQDLLTSYVRRVIEEHPDPGVRAQFLYHGLYYAVSEEDEKTKWLYYSMLQDSHADTRQAEWARRDFDPGKRLQAGNPVPQFSFVSFDDPGVTITSAGLRGQVYLLDFWGTWCAPCIEEIPHLDEAYDKYGESGFEILSVAFLDDPVDIEQFRQDRYPMPWLHTRVAREDDESVRDLFEITSFPRPILVGADGIILAIDDELRDGKLLDAVTAAHEGAE